MSSEMRRIYVAALKRNKVIVLENLSWAFLQETFRLYICSDISKEAGCFDSPVWNPPDNYMDYIEEVYLLRPGEIKRLNNK